jgi:hypothetical protein
MGRGDSFSYFGYVSDDTTIYGVKMSVLVASAGGFTGVSGPVAKFWPFHSRNMRHVWGKNGAARARLPLATASNTLYVSGGSFTLGGTTYVVEGAIGEKRKYNCVA